MTLTLKEVEHIALLARLELDADEKTRYQKQLSDILDYVAQLQKLDIQDQPATATSGLPAARLREDVPRQGLSTEEALRNAPDQRDNQFRVPPVLE
jgi:aspartyl-tRNA(Asn)/glutamyl-tRNA(Gln) amidotransferase subunit C